MQLPFHLTCKMLLLISRVGHLAFRLRAAFSLLVCPSISLHCTCQLRTLLCTHDREHVDQLTRVHTAFAASCCLFSSCNPAAQYGSRRDGSHELWGTSDGTLCGHVKQPPVCFCVRVFWCVCVCVCQPMPLMLHSVPTRQWLWAGEADVLIEKEDVAHRTKSYHDALVGPSAANGHAAHDSRDNHGASGGNDDGNGDESGGSGGGGGGDESADGDGQLTRTNSEFWQGLSKYSRVHRHGKLVHPVRKHSTFLTVSRWRHLAHSASCLQRHSLPISSFLLFFFYLVFFYLLQNLCVVCSMSHPPTCAISHQFVTSQEDCLEV